MGDPYAKVHKSWILEKSQNLSFHPSSVAFYARRPVESVTFLFWPLHDPSFLHRKTSETFIIQVIFFTF